MNPLTIYRISRQLYLWHIPFLPRIFKFINLLVFNCIIPYQCVIGKNTRLFHNGLGLIIHPDVTIGNDCNIYNFIVIGGAHDGPGGGKIKITIGNGCNISAGVKILCKSDELVIGDNTTIAANSVVLHSFPSNVIIGGIPGTIIKEKNEK